MVVCKFFQQGYCRYGQNCRFDHIYGSKYSYHANPPSQPTPQVPVTAGVTDEQLVNQVQTDIQSALCGGQWILSCYSPYKEKPMFPGIHDLSPEEARLFIYEAKANNQLEQAVAHMNNVYKDTRQKYEQLLQPNTTILKVLRSLYKGEVVPSPFSNTQNGFPSNNAASSIFRSAVQTAPAQNTTPSIFSQQANSIFSQQPDPAKSLFSSAVSNIQPTNQNQSVFAQNQTTAQSVFASAVQNNFSHTNQNNPANVFATANQNMFAKEPSQNAVFSQNNSPFHQNNLAFNQPNQNSSPFSQNNPSNSVFSQNTQNNSPFSQSNQNAPFSQTNTGFQGNVFQNSSNQGSVFAVSNSQNVTDSSLYSKMEDLSQEDLEAFKSTSFTLGFVPEIPPPYELCVNKGQF